MAKKSPAGINKGVPQLARPAPSIPGTSSPDSGQSRSATGREYALAVAADAAGPTRTQPGTGSANLLAGTCHLGTHRAPLQRTEDELYGRFVWIGYYLRDPQILEDRQIKAIEVVRERSRR
jgi:hypothetical protein